MIADYKSVSEEGRQKRILIAGAGAAGLMAAISAADAGALVTVLEHKPEAGIKLAITGNGRCNYTNTDVATDKYHYSDEAGRRLVEAVLAVFGYRDCIEFFEQLGIEPKICHYDYDESGYVYPEEMNASGFRDVMYQTALKRGVSFCFGVSEDEVTGTVLAALKGTGSNAYDAVIIATGSNAYPVTGSDSSIYPVFRELGVSLNRFLPALCALYSKDAQLREMKGRRIRSSVTLTIYEAEELQGDSDAADRQKSEERSEKSEEQLSDRTVISYTESGEIQFNEHSISGIPVMQLSAYAAKALKEGRRVRLSIDGHDYEIHRTAGFDRAQTCTGGIAPADIDPHTMRYIGGGFAAQQNTKLYLCGEIIDMDGKCGGYNLHFAWATGYIAGRAAALQSLKLHKA